MSGVSPTAGQKNGRSNRERNSEKANIEYRIMNVECRRDVFCLFKKRLSKAKPSFDILRFDIRYSAVRCSGHLKFHIRFQAVEVLNTEHATCLIAVRRLYCPAGATFSERSLGKSLIIFLTKFCIPYTD